jgi:hypothetical protein
MGVNVGRKEEINKNKSVCSNNIVKANGCITMNIIKIYEIRNELKMHVIKDKMAEHRVRWLEPMQRMGDKRIP